MEDLIKEIQDRTGLPAEKVLEVVTIVTDYMKSVLPEDLINQIASYLGAAATSPSDTATDFVATASEVASKAAGAAANAVGAVLSAVGDLVPTQDDE
ncbi:MAG: hypothetical protein ABFR95_08880 [Actinomycetota bacterium]